MQCWSCFSLPSQHNRDLPVPSLFVVCCQADLNAIESGGRVLGSMGLPNMFCPWNWFSCLCSACFQSSQLGEVLSFLLASPPNACSSGVVESDPSVCMQRWISSSDTALVAASPNLTAAMAQRVVTSMVGVCTSSSSSAGASLVNNQLIVCFFASLGFSRDFKHWCVSSCHVSSVSPSSQSILFDW